MELGVPVADDEAGVGGCLGVEFVVRVGAKACGGNDMESLPVAEELAYGEMG